MKRKSEIKESSKYKEFYKDYCIFMDIMANGTIAEGINARFSYEQWVKDNNIPKEWIVLMEEQIEKEDFTGQGGG